MKPLKLANVTQLTDSLWIGGELSPDDREIATAQLNEITAVGITSIIDCRIERSDMDWVTTENPEIDYLSIGVEDAGLLMPDEWFDNGTTYALDQISAGHIVLSHCQAGINRGPSMGLAILLAQGSDPIDALDLIVEARPVARILYAEDAVSWWFRKMDAPPEVVYTQVRRVRDWRIVNKWTRRSKHVPTDSFEDVDLM